MRRLRWETKEGRGKERKGGECPRERDKRRREEKRGEERRREERANWFSLTGSHLVSREVHREVLRSESAAGVVAGKPGHVLEVGEGFVEFEAVLVFAFEGAWGLQQGGGGEGRGRG